MPARTEQKIESSEVLQAVEEDRKFVYQATIVRLMKGRKVSCFLHVIRNLTDDIDPQTPGLDSGSHCSDLGELANAKQSGQS